MKLKVMFLKSSKHLSKMVHMISWGQGKNNDVINVAFGKTKTYQHLIYDHLKLCTDIFQTKWQKLPWYKQSFPWGSISQNIVLTLSRSLNGN